MTPSWLVSHSAMISYQSTLPPLASLELVISSSSHFVKVPELSLSIRTNSFCKTSSSSWVALMPAMRLNTIFWKLLHFWYSTRLFWRFNCTCSSWEPTAGTSQIQGCSNSSAIEERVFWFLSRHRRMNSFAFGEIRFHCGSEKSTAFWQMFLLIYSMFLAMNGVDPHRSWYVITPRLHTSTFSSYF